MACLRILSLEDDPNDTELIQAVLEAHNLLCEMTRVDTEAAYLAALHNGESDLILADYTLPSFDGLSALRLATELRPDVPFIFVSGTLGEEVAIEAMKIGATDYVLKTRLSRLVPSVERALRETKERAERRRAEDKLRESEERFRTMADTLPEAIWIYSLIPQRMLYLSPSFERIWDLPVEDVQRDPNLWVAAMHPEDRDRIVGIFSTWAAHGHNNYHDVEYRIVRPDGNIRWIHDRAVLFLDEQGRPCRVNGISADVTDRKRADENLRSALLEIRKLKDQLYEENVALKEEIDKVSMFEEIVGESPALQAVLSRVAKVAPTDSTVLITGETGTGKELIARAIHKRSPRVAHAFVAVNCASVPPSLIASELFGHEKGAFTGAIQQRLGRFELAEGGTIFLDEVGELPPETQVALLRVLQEREFERVGGTKSIRTNVRVIAATNRDLPECIEDGTFRRDLYYRLNVVPIEMPALRQRRDDIPLLVEYFIERFAQKTGKKISGISRATLERLKAYGWPGNIRELQNVIERSIIVGDTDKFTVDASWLSAKQAETEEPARLVLRLSASEEKKTIEAVLADTAGRISGPDGAAAKLGIPASTLDSKIRALGINKYRFKARA
jgi:PAS domain S-box-containing protein